MELDNIEIVAEPTELEKGVNSVIYSIAEAIRYKDEKLKNQIINKIYEMGPLHPFIEEYIEESNKYNISYNNIIDFDFDIKNAVISNFDKSDFNIYNDIDVSIKDFIFEL